MTLVRKRGRPWLHCTGEYNNCSDLHTACLYLAVEPELPFCACPAPALPCPSPALPQALPALVMDRSVDLGIHKPVNA